MPDRQSIRQTLIELLEADTGEKYGDLDDGVNLREGLGLDSIDILEVALVGKLLENLKTYAKGTRVGFLTASSASAPATRRTISRSPSIACSLG